MPESLNNISVSMASFAKQAIENRLKDLHTAMPGIIVSFNPTNQTATVQPAIRRIFVTKEEEKTILTPADLPKLIHVPVIFPNGGGFSLTFPVAPNDECLLIFCERDTAAWFKKSGVRTPDTYRMHHLSDAVCIVGMSSEPNKITNFDPDNVVLRDRNNYNYIKITDDENIIINAVNTITINAYNEMYVNVPQTYWVGDIDIEGSIVQHDGNIQTTAPTFSQTGTTTFNGSVTVTGNLVVGAIDFLTHIHGGVTTGVGTTSVPQ